MSNDGATPTYRSGSQSVTPGGNASTPEERGAALAFLQQLATEVSKGTVDLPCFPHVVTRISAALADPATTRPGRTAFRPASISPSDRRWPASV